MVSEWTLIKKNSPENSDASIALKLSSNDKGSALMLSGNGL